MEARVQELLGKSNARIVESLQDQLHDAEGRIDEAARSKEEMAVSMHALQQNALRLRTDLTEAQHNVARLEKQGMETASREESTQKKLREALSRTKELESNLLEAKSKADAKHEENILLQQVCADLKKALKTQELADSATQQHIRFLESQMKQEKLACKEATARLQNSKNETRKLQERLEAQEHETKLAQTHIEKVAQELKILSASKAVIQAQWQASLLAMSKRDEILQEAEKKRDEAEARLESELKSVGSTTQTVTALRAQVKTLEEELALAQKHIASQADHISSQSKQITSTTSSLERERTKGRKMVAVLNESQKAAISGEAHAQRQDQEHQSLLAQVSALKNKLEATERELGIAQEQCRVISAEAAARGAKDASVNERNESELKNRLSRQTAEMQELRGEVARREALAASAEAREREAILRADKLTKEHQHLLAANLRLQHKLNKVVEEQQRKGGQNTPVQEILAAPRKSREESAEALRIKSYEDRLSKAQSVIERQSEEIAVLRAEWSRAEGEMVKARQIHAKLKVPAERRDAELALVRHFNSTAQAEADAQRAAVDRQAVQLDIARAEQRKTNAAKAKLADKNTHLSLALVNNSFWYEAANANLETQVDELKVSLVDSRKAKQLAAKLQLDTESKLALAQHRCRLLDARLEDGRTKLQDAKDHIQRLESKNTKIARENGKLKQAVQKLEQAQLLAERALVNAGNRNNNNNNNNGNNKMRKKSSNQDARVAHDEDARKVQANLYHAETELAQGREHLVKLANQVEEERERAQRLGQAYMEREELAGKLAAQLQESRTSLLQVQASHARAISVAAALEAQLTERTKFINYEPRPGTTPTVNLQSALAKILQPQRPESRQAPIPL